MSRTERPGPPADPLVLDLVEWVARAPRAYAEVMEVWRTSCPRLTVWEDALEQDYVTREQRAAGGAMVAPTAAGRRLLQAHGRIIARPCPKE